jgi:TonB-dependent receptor
VADTEELNGESEVYTVTRPQNGETATVNGYEVALTHVWDNGFGITANATVVNSDAEVSGDTSQTFALPGLGDSQNLIVFYERDAFQARVAFNNRESFLFALDNTSVGGATGEPVTTETYGQWDVSASYDINENFTVFFEGINVTEEELTQVGRFPDQIYSIEDNGSRYAVGIRGSF